MTDRPQPTMAEVFTWARDAGSDDAHQHGPGATFAEYVSRLVDAFGLRDEQDDDGLAAETYRDYLVEFQRVTLAARTQSRARPRGASLPVAERGSTA